MNRVSRYNKMKYFIAIQLLFCINILVAQGNFTLPTYHISISLSDLSKLYANPYSDNYCPATIQANDSTNICEIRFRGASARDLPKKSWKIKFRDDKNSFSTKKINFNSEYRDRSIIRNYLTNSLFEYFNQPASKISFVNLYINNEYFGVFSQIEEVEEDFLDRNKIELGSIYKARSHQANFALIPKYNDFLFSWDKQVGSNDNYSDLIQFQNKLMFYSPSDFNQNIKNDIDIENIINYFAIEFVLVGFDSFTKNYNLYISEGNNNIKLFPWDNDATYGNHWSGTFRDDYITNIDGNQNQNWECLKFNVLFQRLMEDTEFRTLFNERVNAIITSGFDHISDVVDSTYDLIASDYHKDTKKGCTNQRFDDEKDKIKYFMNGRKSFLLNKKLFERPCIEEVFVSSSFPTTNEKLIVEVKLNKTAEIYLDYVPKYDLANGGANFTVNSVKLSDDGSIQDKIAGDLIYSASFTLPNYDKGVIPYAFRIGENYYPANGFSYFGYGPTVSYALSTINSDIDVENSLIVNGVSEYFDDQVILIKNIGISTIDLSYFHLRGKNIFDDFVFPAGTKLHPGNEIGITTNKELASYLYSNISTLEYLSFKVSQNDTLKIYSPANKVVNSKVIESINIPEINADKIIINEINYHSNDTLDTGDWVEFYNPNDYTVHLEGCIFKDSNDDNKYTFPRSAIIAAKSYFVLCQDVELFKSINPNILAKGSFNFGLSNVGESLRLFNKDNILINTVTYSDKEPWSVNADGDGFTLELINSAEENDNALNWGSSKKNGGSPREQNSINITLVSKNKYINPSKFSLSQNYPNPFNPTTTIEYYIPHKKNWNISDAVFVSLKVYDVLGCEVKTLVNNEMRPGAYKVSFNSNNLASGVYYYCLKADGYIETKKMILIR